jgi:hypothetical protein
MSVTNDGNPRIPTRLFHARARVMLSLIDWVGRRFERVGTARDPIWIVAACAVVPALAIAAFALGTVLT